MNRSPDATLVAQVFNLLYRRFSIGRPRELPSREHSQPPPRPRTLLPRPFGTGEVSPPGSRSQRLRKSETGLPMNRPNCNARWRRFSLSPSEGERAGERGPFSRLGSWAQRLRKTESRLSMNRANCDARCRSFSLAPSEGERVGVRGPFSRLGSWSQCMRKSESGLSMNPQTATRAGDASPSPLRKGRGSGRGVPSLVSVHGPNACAKAKLGFP